MNEQMNERMNEASETRTSPTRHLSAQDLKTITGGLGQRGEDLRDTGAASQDVGGQGGSDVIIGSTARVD